MTTPKAGPDGALTDLEIIRVKDNGGSRSGSDRRQNLGECDRSERRSGRDRRRGFDRRTCLDRRRIRDRRHSGNFWDGEIIERRESLRKRQAE